MKKNIFIYILFASLIFIGCKKDDGAIAKSDGVIIESVPVMRITKVAGFVADIIPSTIASYQGKIKVELLYSYTGNALTPPEKVDLVIIKNGNRNDVKVLKAGITTFPSEVTFTGPELVTLFGSVVTCDGFQVGYDVYANGKKYEAYPPGGAAGNGGATGGNQPFFSATLNYNTKVEYDPSIYQGNFVVISDGWGDYAPGNVVPITQVSPTQFSFIYPADGAIPIVVTVNPATLATSVATQVYGTGGYPPGWPYGPISVTSVASADNVVAPCARTWGINLNHTVAAGSFGSYVIKMRKQ